MRKKVLIICSRNAARSQIAEAFLRNLYDDKYEAYSAGVQPSLVSTSAMLVMKEIGIDMSTHRSKSIEKFRDFDFDYVVTVCDHAKETCPFFPRGKHYLHRSFKDPGNIKGNNKEVLQEFRQVRDEIKKWIQATFGK
jgi:arsenate reductase